MLFPPEKIIHYTEGDCWALAIAVHELTGLPMLAVGYSGDDDEPSSERSWMHVVVHVDDNVVLDIHGLRTPDEAIADFLKSHGVMWPIRTSDLQPTIDEARDFGFSHCDSWEQIRADAKTLVSAHLPPC